jgi:hypothetical protein
MAVNNAVQMALCIECSPAVQEVLGSIPDCDALIASRSRPSLLSSGCSPTLYAEDVGGPGQAPTICHKKCLQKIDIRKTSVVRIRIYFLPTFKKDTYTL